jgi:hypothetical protein
VFGSDLAFEPGLVVLQGGNSCGKSTCVQAILYALGLEQMLGPSHEIPLPPSMTKLIQEGDREHAVLESNVFLEIENGRGEPLTIQRGVVGQRDWRLVSVWSGRVMFGESADSPQRDYFLRDPGSASREHGFHTMLAEFLGWQLPTVTTYRDAATRLYLQCIFPLAIVEQKHGWSGIQATMPRFLGIREVERRAFEFVAALDASAIQARRQQLTQREELAKRNWADIVREARQSYETHGAALTGFPAVPTIEFPSDPSPGVLRPVPGGGWIPLSEALRSDREELRRLTDEEIPAAADVTGQAEAALTDLRQKLSEAEAVIAQLTGDLEGEQGQLVAIDMRLEALAEDIGRYNDMARLKRYGSATHLDLLRGQCPTCNQALVDSLLPQNVEHTVLSVEENVAFLGEQRSSFKRMRENTSRRVVALDSRLGAAMTAAKELRAEIRAWKATLIQAGKAPSVAALRKQMMVEARVRESEELEELLADYVSRLTALAREWRAIQEEKELLPDGVLSPDDLSKLRRFETLFREQTQQYGFSSFSPALLGISEHNYLPTREGFDLSFDISASDGVRVIWAYYHGLLELARETATNHPRFLVFDEPQQQKMKNLSFSEFLRRASASSDEDQVVFATSEDPDRLRGMLAGLPHHLVAFEGKLLKRI